MHALNLPMHPVAQFACQEYLDIITHNEIYQFSLRDRERDGITLCTAADNPINYLTNISRGSITQCRNSSRSVKNIRILVALFSILSLIFSTPSIMIYMHNYFIVS